MRPLPADPLAFHALVISAFCDDIASGKGWERTNALREVSIQSKEREGQLNKRLPND